MSPERPGRGELGRALEEMVGKDNVLTEEVDLLPYSADHFLRGLQHYFPRFRFLPDAVVTPSSTAQVSRILRFASLHRIPVIPRGAGTSLAGQLIPVEGGIVMDLKKMNRIEPKVEDRMVVAGPGATYAELNRELERRGYFFPPEPGSAMACTVGGMVSTNASGSGAVKYGATRNYVLSLEVVLAGGEVVRLGRRVTKSASGYSLKDLFVGSEGTLGVITEVTLRVEPYPPLRRTTLAVFPSLEDAFRSAMEILGRGITPASLELLDELCLLALNMSGFSLPEGKGALMLRSDGRYEEAVEREMGEMEEVCRGRGAQLVGVEDEGLGRRLWEAREKISASLTKLLPSPETPRLVFQSSVDVGLPLSRMLEYVSKVKALMEEKGIMGVCFGHVGDGNVHIGSTFVPESPEQVERARSFQEEAIRLALSLGGTLTAEHGVGLWKAPYLEEEHGPALELMRSLKRLLDPQGILNPGKMALEGIPRVALMERWWREG